ncbi:Hypothetical protein D9617_22g067370 [Elsinoe fawcettii]|nr:Hypothetical protein D9617_22g067370 [Elsinoe fawcettii]
MSADQLSTISSVYECLATREAWRSTANFSFSNGGTTLRLGGSSTWFGVTRWANEYFVTGCDGVPRHSFSGGTTGSYYLSSHDGGWVLPYTNVVGDGQYVGTPPCTSVDEDIVEKYCSQIVSMYHENERIYSSYSRRGTSFLDLPKSLPRSGCIWTGVNPRLTECNFNIGTAHLYHFPDDRYKTTPPLCPLSDTSPITVMPPQQTGTVVVEGQTFTSPSVYIKYEDINFSYSFQGNWSQWSKASTYLPFKSEDVHSVCRVGAKTVPYNFRDMYGELPWSAWGCAHNCSSLTTGNITRTWGPLPFMKPPEEERCTGIDTVRYPYKPILAWPEYFSTVIASLYPGAEPEYDCDFGMFNGGIYDPPQLLTKAPVLTTPAAAPKPIMTIPGAITPEPAMPSREPKAPATRTEHANGGATPTYLPDNGNSDPSSGGGAGNSNSGSGSGSGSGGPGSHQQNGAADNAGSGAGSGSGSNNAGPNIGGAIISMINLPPSNPIQRPTPLDPDAPEGTPISALPILQPIGNSAADPALGDPGSAAGRPPNGAGGSPKAAGSSPHAADAWPNAPPGAEGSTAGTPGSPNTPGAPGSSQGSLPNDPSTPPAVWINNHLLPLYSSITVPLLSGLGTVQIAYTPSGLVVDGTAYTVPRVGAGQGVINLPSGGKVVVKPASAADLATGASGATGTMAQAVVVDGMTIALGTERTVDGMRVSYGTAGLVVGSRTVGMGEMARGTVVVGAKTMRVGTAGRTSAFTAGVTGYTGARFMGGAERVRGGCMGMVIGGVVVGVMML